MADYASEAGRRIGRFVEGEHFRVAESGCWEWILSTKNGYGQFSSGKYAHRAAFVAAGKDKMLPSGYLVTHLCDNRACVNPDHLVVGTKRTNMLDIRSREPKKWARIAATQFRSARG